MVEEICKGRECMGCPKCESMLNLKASLTYRRHFDEYGDPVYEEGDVREFINNLKEFIISRKTTLELNKNNPSIDWKTTGTTELSNVLFQLDKLAGDKLTQ